MSDTNKTTAAQQRYESARKRWEFAPVKLGLSSIGLNMVGAGSGVLFGVSCGASFSLFTTVLASLAGTLFLNRCYRFGTKGPEKIQQDYKDFHRAARDLAVEQRTEIPRWDDGLSRSLGVCNRFAAVVAAVVMFDGFNTGYEVAGELKQYRQTHPESTQGVENQQQVDSLAPVTPEIVPAEPSDKIGVAPNRF